MPRYNKNTKEYRLLLDIIKFLIEKFDENMFSEKKAKIAILNSKWVVNPQGVLNDITDNKFGTVKNGIVTITINNTKKTPLEKDLEKEMQVIINCISHEGTSRDDVLKTLKKEGFGRKGRSLLQKARKEGLIKGTVINKVPTYFLVE